MSFLSDGALRHLREVADLPDLSATKYRLVSRLERGGMGTVYVADDTELARPVALKVLSAPDDGGSLARRLLNEARILARLEHPGVVPVHDVGTLPDGRVFYVMKLVRGRTLDAVVAQLTERSEALRIFQRLCEAVAFAHAHGVLHRDLKPQNIMVGEFGEVLVMDWGVAKVIASNDAHDTDIPGHAAGDAGGGTQHGTRIGTPGYMAPEQAAGDVEHIDARTDVYALGAILAFLLANGAWVERRGPGGSTPAAALEGVHPRIPAPLRAICHRALSEDPAGRYESVAQLAAELRRFADGHAVLAYPEGPLRRTARFVSRYRTAVALVITYMVVRVLLLLFR